MDKKLLDELRERYKLSENEHKAVFDKIVKASFDGKTADISPIFNFVLAQPGSGKTTFINSKKYDNFVVVDANVCRSFRKDRDELIDNFPEYYFPATRYDAHLHCNELIDLAMKGSYNILREEASLKPENVLLPFESAPKNYRKVVDVIANGNISSMLSAKERYEDLVLRGDKVIKMPFVNKANGYFENTREIVKSLEGEDVTINVYVRADNNSFMQVYPSSDFGSAYEAMLYYQDLDDKNLIDTFYARLNAVVEKMKMRNANAEQFEQIEYLKEFFENYKNSLNK